MDNDEMFRCRIEFVKNELRERSAEFNKRLDGIEKDLVRIRDDLDSFSDHIDEPIQCSFKAPQHFCCVECGLEQPDEMKCISCGGWVERQ